MNQTTTKKIHWRLNKVQYIANIIYAFLKHFILSLAILLVVWDIAKSLGYNVDLSTGYAVLIVIGIKKMVFVISHPPKIGTEVEE